MEKEMDDRSSTLIIGARGENGVVMIADKRTMRGLEYKEERKIFTFYGVVTGFAGLTGLKDKFLETVEGVLQKTRAMNLHEAIYGIEDTLESICNRYSNRLRGELHIEALSAGLENLTSGKAKLHHIFGNGYAEKVDFLCIGHGAPYATPLGEYLFKPNLPLEDLIRIGVFLVKWVSNIDTSVGGIPDVVIVKDDEQIKDMDKDEVRAIYKNSEEIAKELPKLLFESLKDPKLLGKVSKKEKGK